MPASRAIAATVSGASPEMTFSSTPSSVEELHRVLRLRPQLLGEHDEAERPDARRGAPPSAASGAVVVPSASTRRPARDSRAARGREAVEPEQLRRAEHEAAAVEPHRAPAACATRTGTCASAVLGVPGYDAAIAASVELRLGRARREAREVALELRGAHTGRRLDADDPQRRLGERAGLVEAHDVDRGERLDGVELLRERAAP